MERMSPLDASFLYIEDGVTHMVIASCAVFESPPPPYEDVVDLMRAKLPLIPRYRQVVHFVPMQLGRPVWVDDPHFLLEYPSARNWRTTPTSRSRPAAASVWPLCPTTTSFPSA